MTAISVPHKKDVSAENRKYFDFFQDKIGQMPNLYAMMTYAQQALDSYIRMQNRKQALSRRERVAVSLVMATLNGSAYCLENHYRAAKLNDFSDDQITEISLGTATFDDQLNAVVPLAHAIALTRGRPEPALLEHFFSTGYTPAHLVDLVVCIGDNIIANFLSQVMMVPPDPEQDMLLPE
jgi:AhpD family alkylhydroperoxidase